MIKTDLFTGIKAIPFLLENIKLSLEGELELGDGSRIDLAQFNAITRLDVTDVSVLTALTYQRFTWPPSYWRYLRALRTIDGVSTPESLVLSIAQPVQSLEFPGFFMIPYFSNYVISPTGDLIKKSDGRRIQASQTSLGYYTFRMTDDSGKTQNQLRHRVLCYAFKTYGANVEDLDVNHRDGVPGHDNLENLEWCTRSENMEHAYIHGLRTDNRQVQIRDVATGHVYVSPSYSMAGRLLGVTETTISNRAKTNGYKAYDGYQFRPYPYDEPWPNIQVEAGDYLVEFPDGTSIRCSCNEAARHAGVTRTSLLRILREGRNHGTTPNKITRL